MTWRLSFQFILEGGRYFGPFLKKAITSLSLTMFRSPVIIWEQGSYLNLDLLQSHVEGELSSILKSDVTGV